MSIKDIKLRKGMSREEVNALIGGWLTFEDEVYLGNGYKHNWKCKCGNIFIRQWGNISIRNHVICKTCKKMSLIKKYKYLVSQNKDYEFINVFVAGDVLPNGRVVKNNPYIQIKHNYCGRIYEVLPQNFIVNKQECSKCCKKYENSFAYYIEQELGEPLEKYWDFDKNIVNPYNISKNYNGKVWIKCTKTDYHGSYETVCPNFIKGHECNFCASNKVHPKDSFAQYHIDNTSANFLEKYWDFEKNTVNPYYISRSSNKKVWIKCTEKDYHGSYEVRCSHFTNGKRCRYCNGKKVHPKDSFAQYHIDNTDKNFLVKYWSDKNTVNPWSIKPNSTIKVWIKCQEKDYHNDDGGYEIRCYSFLFGHRCSYCNKRKIHPLDSFGYHNFDKVMSWHPGNNISPFRVAPSSNKKFKFICPECGFIWETQMNVVSKGSWCPQCASSKGEQEIAKWLKLNNIEFIPQKIFNVLTGFGGGNLSYDFYLPEYNLLIEYQGKQHEEFIKGFHMTERNFKKQQEHDKRKKNYAKENEIGLLEIWYWDFDNIENILKNELNI